MISAQQVIDIALEAAARRGRADETIVLVTDRIAASLRWANNSMTTNGVSTARSTTVISIVRQGDTARVGSLTSSEVDPSVIEGLVAASQAAAVSAPDARDAAPLLSGNGAPGRLGCSDAGHRPRGVRRRRPRAESRLPWQRPVVRLCPARAGDGVSGDIGRIAAPLHPAHRFGGDQRQTRRCQRVGGGGHARFRRCANGFAAGAAVDAAGLGRAQRRAARRPLRDHPAAVGGGRHDDLPGLVDGRSRRAGGPHRVVLPRRRNPGGGAADRSAADAVFRSERARFGVHAVRGDRQFVGDACRFSTTAWTSSGWTGSATG